MTKEQYNTLYKLFREYETLGYCLRTESEPDYSPAQNAQISRDQDSVRGQFLTFMATLIK